MDYAMSDDLLQVVGYMQTESLLLQIFIILGALGLFLFGMKTMSEALQRIAGGKLRSILSSVMQTPVRQVLVGMFLTAIIQSSSATTVMIVGFVNAGLLNLLQAIGMVMGANIGTTATAWLIALFGFETDLGLAAVPLIAVGFPMLFARREKTKAVGNIVIGFALLFLAIAILKGVMGDLTTDQDFASWLRTLGHRDFWSLLAFFGVGLVMTIAIQSSSATIALTIIMCANGWIPFDCGLAMILGENVGTTSTANIAASVTNANARRTALAHTLFNLFGVCWALPLIPVATEGLDALFTSVGGASPIVSNGARPVALALYHTLFNTINTLLLIGFIPQLASVVTRLIPGKSGGAVRLHIGSALMSTDGISSIQAQRELRQYARRVSRMFARVRNLFRETNGERFDTLVAELEAEQAENNRFRSEYVTYLSYAMESSADGEAKRGMQTMFRLVSDLEVLSESTYSIAKLLRSKKEKRIWFTQRMRDDLNGMFDLVDEALETMLSNLDRGQTSPTGMSQAADIESRINALRTELKDKYLHYQEEDESDYRAAIVFTDLVTHVELLADVIVHISEGAQNIQDYD